MRAPTYKTSNRPFLGQHTQFLSLLPLFSMTDTDLPSTGSSPPVKQGPATRSRLAAWAIACALAVVTLGVFGQSFLNSHEFVNYDDHHYVIDNAMVRSGINAHSLRWVTTAVVAANWHPLTMLTHMLDIELFGFEGVWGHHLVNVLWHLANVLLLFGVMQKMTGRLWCSALVAALFAWHPLRAESVAWISERKDVLSGFFWIATLWAYWYYTQRRNIARYLLIVASLGLGLLAKPMLVTLPCVLLLLDYWPLNRFQWQGWQDRSTWRCGGLLVAEKLPLFVLVGILSGVTIWAQSSQSAVVSTELLSLGVRVSNSVMSYNHYISKTLLPVSLYVPYPIESRNFNLVHALLSASGLLLVSFLAARGARTRPYLFVGWFWYLGTLVPVIGLVQVGGQAMADRYTYLPSIGLYIIAAWGLRELVEKNAALRLPVVSACGVVLAVLAGLCFYQVSLWKNSVTLFEHAIRHNPDDAMSHARLGTGYQTAGRLDEAIEQYEQALELRPGLYLPLYNMGKALIQRNDPNQNDLARAEEYLEEAVSATPNPTKAHAGLAFIKWKNNDLEVAYAHGLASIKGNPSSPGTLALLGQIATSLKRHHEAILWYEESRRRDPTNTQVVHNLALLYALAPDPKDRNPALAVQLATEIVQAADAAGKPNPFLLSTLAAAQAEAGDFAAAEESARRALELAESLAARGDGRMQRFAGALAKRVLSYQQQRPHLETLDAPGGEFFELD